MKKLLMTAATLVALAIPATAFADYTLPAVPKNFQGVWICNVGSTIIGTDTVSYGSPLKLISIVPGDEELNTITVKWVPPNSVRGVVVAAVWKLIKLNGQQFLMEINEESPTSASLCLKKDFVR